MTATGQGDCTPGGVAPSRARSPGRKPWERVIRSGARP
ncbi:hypothetical protein F750_6667 [Streptomyces sp. PAMC 26508]|nr:hypothetical protein F750_6667 [Streptomyces sp. PAMC 26508]